MELGALTLGVLSLNHWTIKEVPTLCLDFTLLLLEICLIDIFLGG